MLCNDWCEKKRLEQQKKLEYISPQFENIHTHPDFQQIINSSAAQIREKTLAGHWKVEVVVKSFCFQAYQAHLKTNCLTEILFEEAIERAKWLDKWEMPRDGFLFGVPISIKDHFDYRGYDSTIGMEVFTNKPREETSALVKQLESEGAVVFCKTNVPQTMLTFECRNPIFGNTINPFSKDYTCGGSSGGEAALLASNGSVLGCGSDMGGSLRIPAAFCGICSLRPSFGRASLLHNTSPISGQAAIRPVFGPMAKKVEDLELWMKASLNNEPWLNDTFIVPIPFREVELPNRKWKVAYYLDDGFISASSACKRAVLETVQVLRDAGHEIIEWQPPRVLDVMSYFYSIVLADKGKQFSRNLKGTLIDEDISYLLRLWKIPNFVKQFMSWLLHLYGEKEASQILYSTQSLSVLDLWDVQLKAKNYKNEFFKEWHNQEFDICICPVHPLPAAPHHSFRHLTFSASYTVLYNILDFTVGVLPVTKVQKSDQLTKQPRHLLEKILFSYYDPVKSEGLPVGVQIVGPGCYKEELTLKFMKEIETLLEKRKNN